MASRPAMGAPEWPAPTPHPVRQRRRRKWDATQQPSSRSPRQLLPATKDSNDCGALPDNAQFTCFPTAESHVVQNIPTRLVWNTNVPIFSQTRIVDVYLYHGDTDDYITSWMNREYPKGHLSVTPNDTWWGEEGQHFTPGHNQTRTFYFVMVVNGTDPRTAAPAIPQSTFTATQTDFPNSILAAQSSSSLASMSASLASISASAATTIVTSTSGSGDGNLQGDSADDHFPHWAIALLAVFGFLALLAFIAVFWLLIRHLRRRHREEMQKTHRNSIGSESPMMADIGGQNTNGGPSPVTAESGLGPLPTIVTTGAGAAAGARHNVQSDGASTISRTDSAGGPFSQTDAAAMAAAFRNVMRKPDFTDQPMEEGVVGQVEGDEDDDEEVRRHEHEVLMGRELAEEGRDIRSVSSSRGVRVETLSDGERNTD